MEQLCWVYTHTHTQRQDKKKQTVVEDKKDFRVFHPLEYWKDVMLGTHAVIKGEKLCCPPAVFFHIYH